MPKKEKERPDTGSEDKKKTSGKKPRWQPGQQQYYFYFFFLLFPPVRVHPGQMCCFLCRLYFSEPLTIYVTNGENKPGIRYKTNAGTGKGGGGGGSDRRGRF